MAAMLAAAVTAALTSEGQLFDVFFPKPTRPQPAQSQSFTR